MKKPFECNSIEDVRKEIDRIDKQIIEEISERFQYVKEIVKYKSNKDDVKAQKRYDEVFHQRRKWAEEKGISADVVEQIYKILVHYFIDEQMKLLKEKQL